MSFPSSFPSTSLTTTTSSTQTIPEPYDLGTYEWLYLKLSAEAIMASWTEWLQNRPHSYESLLLSIGTGLELTPEFHAKMIQELGNLNGSNSGGGGGKVM